jgi:hypothetical protein
LSPSKSEEHFFVKNCFWSKFFSSKILDYLIYSFYIFFEEKRNQNYNFLTKKLISTKAQK